MEIENCINGAAVFIAVLSANYCDSFYCNAEIEEARSLGKPIILIYLEDIEQDRMSPCVKEIFWNYTRAKVRFSDDPHILQSNLEKVCETILELKNKDNSIDNHSFLVDQDKFTRFANMLLSYKHFIIPNSYLIICCMVCIFLAGIFIILWV